MKFTIGPAAVILQNANVNLGGNSLPATAAFEVWNDNAGDPNTAGGAICQSGVINVAAAGTYTATFAAACTLTANTAYWLVSTSPAGNPGTASWNAGTGSPVTNGLATYGGTKFSNTAGVTWIDTTAVWNDVALAQLNGIVAAPPPAPASIPTLSEWGMILLASLLAIGSVITLRRQGF